MLDTNTAIDDALERKSSVLDHEPFPSVKAGSEVLRDQEIVRLVETGTFGKYRVGPRGSGQAGPAFLVTLFGATCSKIELLGIRKLGSRDYLAAVKHAIEREIGYWQNRGEPLPRDEGRLIEVTIRDADFVLP
jgi:hypothetical protein